MTAFIAVQVHLLDQLLVVVLLFLLLFFLVKFSIYLGSYLEQKKLLSSIRIVELMVESNTEYPYEISTVLGQSEKKVVRY